MSLPMLFIINVFRDNQITIFFNVYSLWTINLIHVTLFMVTDRLQKQNRLILIIDNYDT